MGTNLKETLIFSFVLLLVCCTSVTAEKVVVVSSYQDDELAEFLARSFNYTLILIPWGSQDEKYVDKLKEINPDKIIIIGGEFAVPKAFEIGNFERYGGQNRFETAQIILREFFNITLNTTNNILYIPNHQIVKTFIEDGGKWRVIIGNSSVSYRWGRLIENELKRRQGERNSTVLIGNTENNPLIKRLLPIDPLSLYPGYILLGNNTLLISGDDAKIPYVVKYFDLEKKFVARDLVKFTLVLVFLSFLSYFLFDSKERYLAYLLILISSCLLALWGGHLARSYISHDAYFVYLDGALSLKYLHRYETILTNRGFPGLSVLLFLWFLIFEPSVESTSLYQLFVLFFLFLAIFLLFKNWKFSIITIVTLFLVPLFRAWSKTLSTELTFLMLLTFSTVFIEKVENFKSEFLLFFSTVLSALVRLQALVLPIIVLATRRDKRSIRYLATVVGCVLLISKVIGLGLLGYGQEVAVKGALPDVPSNFKLYVGFFRFYPLMLILPPLLLILHRKLNLSIRGVVLNLLALAYFIMPLFWVEAQERYLLPGIYFSILAFFIEVENAKELRNKLMKRGG